MLMLFIGWVCLLVYSYISSSFNSPELEFQKANCAANRCDDRVRVSAITWPWALQTIDSLCQESEIAIALMYWSLTHQYILLKYLNLKDLSWAPSYSDTLCQYLIKDYL